MAALSEGTGDKSVLATQRFTPRNAMHSQGEMNVTVDAGSLPNVDAITRNAAKANGAHFTAPAYTTLSSPRESNFETHEHEGDFKEHEWACHRAAFYRTLPSMEAEIDCTLQSNSV